MPCAPLTFVQPVEEKEAPWMPPKAATRIGWRLPAKDNLQSIVHDRISKIIRMHTMTDSEIVDAIALRQVRTVYAICYV